MRIVGSFNTFVCSNSLASFLPFGAGTITSRCSKISHLAGRNLDRRRGTCMTRPKYHTPTDPTGIADRESEVRLCLWNHWNDVNFDMPKNQTDVLSSYIFISSHSYGLSIQNLFAIVKSRPHSGPLHAVDRPATLLAHDNMRGGSGSVDGQSEREGSHYMRLIGPAHS